MSKLKAADKQTKHVEKELIRKYLPSHPDAKVAVYRYNSASIRVRIIDSGFEGEKYYCP